MNQQKKETRKNDKLRKNYESVCERYGINENTPVNTQIEEFIEICSNIQGQICENRDSIEAYYEQVKAVMKMTKACWNNLIYMNIRRGVIKENAVEKLKGKLLDELYYLTTKSSFLLNSDFDTDYEFSGDNVIYIPKEDELDFCNEYDENSDLGKILKQATQLKAQIVEWSKDYADIKLAIEYLTKGDITSGEFKEVVDFYHFAGSSNEKYPDRMAKFTEKIAHNFNFFEKYDLKLLNEYLNGLGLKIVKVNENV